MRILIFTNGCELEEVMEEEKEINFYEKLLWDNRSDEEAISYFEKKYPNYCDIIEIPENATDYYVNDDDDIKEVFAIINGNIEQIYFKRCW